MRTPRPLVSSLSPWTSFVVPLSWPMPPTPPCLALPPTAWSSPFIFCCAPANIWGAPKPPLTTFFDSKMSVCGLGGGSSTQRRVPLPTSKRLPLQRSATFTSQKNGIRGEKISHSRSGHPTLCPVLCLISRIIYLRLYNASPTTPLNATLVSGTAVRWSYLQPAAITSFLRAAVVLAPDLGILPSDVSARSTRAGGAMAMMCAGIDCDRIRLIGRWRSDEMYRYLHVQAQPVMNGVATAMFRGGHYRLTPGLLPPNDFPTLPAPPP